MAHPNTGNDTPGFTQLQPVLPRPRNPTTPGDLPKTGVVAAKVGKLTNGSQVYIGVPCKDGWCQVNSNQIQRGYGFVEQSHLQFI